MQTRPHRMGARQVAIGPLLLNGWFRLRGGARSRQQRREVYIIADYGKPVAVGLCALVFGWPLMVVHWRGGAGSHKTRTTKGRIKLSDIDKKVRGRPIFAKVGIAVAIFLCFTELGTSPWRPSGIPSAVVFFAVAIGLLKRNRWSGYGGALFLAAEYVGSMVEFARFGWPTWLSLAGPVALHGSLAYLLFRAGRALSGNGVRIFKWLWIVPAVGELLFALLFASFTESIGAMEPTLLFGDFLVIRVLAVPAPVHAGLIAYLSDGRMYVVRCIGVPGDRIKIVNKQVYLNGGKLDEPYAYHKKEYIERYRDNFPSEPDRHIFGGAWDMLGHHVENGEVVVPP